MKRQSGFTLVELLVTLAAATVLMSVAIPSFKTTIQNGRMVTQANDLLGALVFARSQAVTAAKDVVVCASNSDQTACDTSGTWAGGWIICQPDCSAPANILRVHEAVSGGNTITNDSALKTLTFDSTGAVSGVSGLYFDICDGRGASYGRAIYVYPAGQAKVSPTVGKKLDGTTTLSC